MRVGFSIPAVLAAVAACSAGPTEFSPGGAMGAPLSVQLAPLSATFRHGDTLRFDLTNSSGGAVEYSRCPGRWLVHVGDEVTANELLESCATGGATLANGATVQLDIVAPPELSGDVQQVIWAWPAGQSDRREGIASTLFRIEP